MQLVPLPMALEWQVAPLDWSVAVDGSLRIVAGPRTDLFVDPAGEAAARRSGIAFSAHDLRRSAARWMAEANVPMEVIAQCLGHSTTRITYQHYARFSPRFMADAVAALDW